MRVAALLLTAGVLAATLTTAEAAGPSVTAHDFTVTSSLDGTELVARYYRPAAKGTYPVVLTPHGGGGNVDSEAPRAARYAAIGFVGVVWSARGHGTSGGLFDVFGPKTVQDAQDVLQWVISNRAQTGAHPTKAGAVGISQGGGTVNLLAAKDPRIKVIGPGQTFSGLQESLQPNGCTKLTVDTAILGAAYTAMGARVDPTLLAPWTTYLATGFGGDAVKKQWTERSPRSYTKQTTQPTLWVQAFDDPLFPVDQAARMQALRSGSDVRLWLSWGGHFAASSTAAEVAARESAWTGLLQRVLQGKKTPTLPRVTWWYRAADGKSLVRRAAPSWPPPGVRSLAVPLATGTVLAAGSGTADDPVVEFAARSAGVQDSVGQVLKSLPRHSAAETLVSSSAPLKKRTIVAGAPQASLMWTSTAADSQLVVKLYDVAPDGSAALLSSGCTAVKGAAGTARRVTLALSHTAVEVAAGHRLQVWVQGSDAPTWLPAQQPAADTVGAGSRLLVPLLDP
jgi:ABC-2 type transport system ATP-binding protein